MAVTLEQAMQRAKSYEREGRKDLAIRVYESVLRTYPANKRAKQAMDRLLARHTRPGDPPQQVLAQVLALHQKHHYSRVVERCEALLKDFPKSTMLWNLLGIAKLALGDHDPAEAALRKAHALTPQSPEPLANLGKVLRAKEDFVGAEKTFLKAIEVKPDHIAAHNGLGELFRVQDMLEPAADSYRRTLEIDPDNAVALGNLGEVLKLLRDFEGAYRCLTRALELRPNVSDLHIWFGDVETHRAHYHEAIASYHRALEIDPNQGGVYRAMGQTLRLLGDKAAALEAFETALEIDPSLHMVYRMIALAITFEPGHPLMDRLQALYDSGDLDDMARSHVCFALSKAWEDLGDEAKAFALMSEGNACRKRAEGYDISTDQRLFQDARKVSATLGERFCTEPKATVKPIFILGMPRSGTSLVEQIVASHSQVTDGGELLYLNSLVGKIVHQGQPVTDAQIREVRASYLERLAPHSEGTPWVTDKMPHNFRWIPFIVACFPEAPIIYMDRDPRAVCWSNFSHYFPAEGLNYTCDLGDTVAYYKLFASMMTDWRARYPGRIYKLNYERLTENQEEETRRLLAHLGLDWEDACLNFHRSGRATRTASMDQVKQKMYTGSSKGWRKYEAFIGDAFDSL